MKIALLVIATLLLTAAVAHAQFEEGNNPQVRPPPRVASQPSTGRPASTARPAPQKTTRCSDGTASKVAANPCAGHGGVATSPPPNAPERSATNPSGYVTPPAQ